MRLLANTLTAIAAMCGAAFAQQAELPVPEKKPDSSFQTPILGPEFPGLILPPDQRKQSQPAKSAQPQPPNHPPNQSSKDPPDLAFGAFQRGYYLTALKLALPRAESGDPAAQTLIAELYWNGFGVARDRKKAIVWYRFAANGDNREAQFSYANILLRGELVPVDKALGEQFMRKAADKGHPLAQFNVAQIITAQRPTWASFKSALPYYEAAAKQGVADAQYALANIYSEAKGVPFNDDVKARNWLEQAAIGGLDTAQIEFGGWLATGRGGEKDLNAARNWFMRAAAQGNVIAQNRLARIYAFGLGVEKDTIKAGAWHILARRAGFSDSEMDNLFQNLPEIDKKRAIEAANQLSRRNAS